MRVPRNFSVFVQYFLDEWVPPRIRDSKWFMIIPMKVLFKDNAKDFMGFKDTVFGMTPQEFGGLYERTAHVQELQGETDLNQACVREIMQAASYQRILEVGCGRGYLADKLSKKHTVTACDIVVPDNLPDKYPKVTFIAGNIENLPFKDDEFDTVISTHTLEHVQHLHRAVNELRRVARKELIIVVPRQRPYKYTFSLHTQFFPYAWSIRGAFGYREGAYVKKLGDWFYYEPNPRPDKH